MTSKIEGRKNTYLSFCCLKLYFPSNFFIIKSFYVFFFHLIINSCYSSQILIKTGLDERYPTKLLIREIKKRTSILTV